MQIASSLNFLIKKKRRCIRYTSSIFLNQKVQATPQDTCLKPKTHLRWVYFLTPFMLHRNVDNFTCSTIINSNNTHAQ